MTLEEYLRMHEELETIQHGLFKLLINSTMVEFANVQLIRAQDLTLSLYEYSDSYSRMGLIDLFYTFQRLEEMLSYTQRKIT